MKILIADDHDLLRDTLVMFFENEGGIETEAVGSFDDAFSLIEGGAEFDLVLLDYNMPGMNGLDGLQKAIGLRDGMRVALMSGEATKKIAEAALEAGAAGFVPKSLPAKSLVNAVKFMAMGETYVPLDFLNAEEAEADIPLAKQLTERELQVLGGLCRGLSNKELARELDLQEVTIKLHVKTSCRKLDAKNRTHAAMIGKEAGLF